MLDPFTLTASISTSACVTAFAYGAVDPRGRWLRAWPFGADCELLNALTLTTLCITGSALAALIVTVTYHVLAR